MRIAIDARLNAYRQGGIPQYTRLLMGALAEVASDDQIISLQHRAHLRPLVMAPNVSRRTVFTPPHHRLEQWSLPAEVLLARPTVLHCPDFIAPLRRTFPAVVTIHDLAFLHYPQILDDGARAYYGRVKESALRANAVIAVSEATRQDIAQLLDIPADQIDVIHEAASPLYSRIDLRPGEVRVLDGTPVAAGSFMLFVSTLEPRKNLPTLLQALRILLDRSPSAGYRLVVAGSRGWRDEEIFTTLRDLNLESHVVFARRVGQYDLRWLYNACRLYINPSLYEGFGLPLLEAMACGAPSLAAATSSLPEIGGEAAVYVPPLEPDQWADEIAALWVDEDRRAELSRRGRVQSQRFSWLRAARETLAVYRRAIERADSPATTPAPLRTSSTGLVCPRCGAPLAAASLTGSTSVRLAAEDARTFPLHPAAQLCRSCGQVQLEADIAAPATPPPLDLPPAQTEPVPALASAADPLATAELPVASHPEDNVPTTDDVPATAVAQPILLPSEAPAPHHPAPLQEPAAAEPPADVVAEPPPADGVSQIEVGADTPTVAAIADQAHAPPSDNHVHPAASPRQSRRRKPAADAGEAAQKADGTTSPPRAVDTTATQGDSVPSAKPPRKRRNKQR